jgi:hypothetical protein
MVKAKCSLWINSAVIEILLLRSVALEWERPYQSYAAGALHDEGRFARTETTYILVPALYLTLKNFPSLLSQPGASIRLAVYAGPLLRPSRAVRRSATDRIVVPSMSSDACPGKPHEKGVSRSQMNFISRSL